MFSYLDDHANALITSTQQSRPAPPSTRLSPLPPEPADFYNDFATPVDIPMDTNRDIKTREKDLLAKEAELNRREKVTGSKQRHWISPFHVLLSVEGSFNFLT